MPDVIYRGRVGSHEVVILQDYIDASTLDGPSRIPGLRTVYVDGRLAVNDERARLRELSPEYRDIDPGPGSPS